MPPSGIFAITFRILALFADDKVRVIHLVIKVIKIGTHCTKFPNLKARMLLFRRVLITIYNSCALGSKPGVKLKKPTGSALKTGCGVNDILK